MKKKIIVALILLCVMAFAISYASAIGKTAITQELPEIEIMTEAILPESVTIIEDEAFEGTALLRVAVPDTVTEIGERAFANILSLRNVRITSTTTYIASTAFEDSNRTAITAPAKSYARTWAKDHGIPFSPIIIFCASTQTTATSVMFIDRSKEIIEPDSSSDCKPDNQWRRIEEVNITQTEELIANHVQGRSPPMA